MGINIFCKYTFKKGTMFRYCKLTDKQCKYGQFNSEYNCDKREDPIRPDPPKGINIK